MSPVQIRLPPSSRHSAAFVIHLFFNFNRNNLKFSYNFPDPFPSKSKSSSQVSLKNKRVRTIFTPEQLERLEAEFERQQYMVGPERLYLAHTLQLTEAQVSDIWIDFSHSLNNDG